MIKSTFAEAQEQPPKSKYPGRKVWNKDAKKWMHMIASYKNFGRKVGIYSDAFDIFIDTLATRLYHDQQNVICIYGETGSGKSSLGLNICVQLAKRIGCGFNLDEDYIYTTQDLYNKLDNPKANPISLFDEGSVTLASINAVRKSDRDIVTLFNTMRSRHWTTIICNPTFEKINRAVREDHCEFRIKCNSPNHPLVKGYSRGFFMVREISRQDFQQEPYWPLRYTGVFGDYPPELREQYLQIKHRHQDELISTIRMVAQTENAKTRKQAEKYLAPEDIPDNLYLNRPEDTVTVNTQTPEVVKTHQADQDAYMPDEDTQPVKKTRPKNPDAKKQKRTRGPTPQEIDKAIKKALNAQRKEVEKEERKKDKEWMKIVQKQSAEIERLKQSRKAELEQQNNKINKINKTKKNELERIQHVLAGNEWEKHQGGSQSKPVTATATDNAEEDKP